MDPVLYKAATSGSIDLFEKKDPSFFLQETLEKNSALHLAAKLKRKQFAEKIIALHTQLLYQANSKGDTPLHIAASVGCLEIADLIITIHLNTESRDVEANKDLLTMQNLDKDTALHNAVRNDHFEIVKLLIDKDKELAANIINANGDSPLFLAVDRSHFTIARYILDEVPDCSYQGRNQMNALHAVILRDFKLKSFLWWKIVFFSREGYTFMREFIQECPSAIKESDEFGWTPLHYAAFLGNTIAVELLLENNDVQMPTHTYVYHKDKEGLSALHIAAKKGRVQVMKQLTETFPEICELVDERGRTALHVAVENRMVYAVRFVLKTPSLEGLINVRDTEGNTSLHLAAIHGHYTILYNLLYDSRVDKKDINKEGFTAIEIIESKMELIPGQKSLIARKLRRAGGFQSLEGILRRENREKENVEMNEPGHIESIKDRAGEKEREGMVMKNLSLDTKRKRAEDKELIRFNRIKEIATSHTLVATIIATVTFAAGFTMPGGYKSDQGMAVLSGKTSFQLFLISDTIAFCFSAISMFFHFSASVQPNRYTSIYLIGWASRLTYISIFAMVIAFISGTNVVLAGSPGLAIANIVIGCCSFLLIFIAFYTRQLIYFRPGKKQN